jgi:hypothetical protein
MTGVNSQLPPAYHASVFQQPQPFLIKRCQCLSLRQKFISLIQKKLRLSL